MEQTQPSSTDKQVALTEKRPARKRYTRPAIVSETRLETRAGTPVSVPVNPLDMRNDYGL